MIEVSVGKDNITIQGHSGYAASGSDIVCAGVSALFQTMIKATLDLTDDKIIYNVNPGFSDVVYNTLSEKAKILKESFLIGISMMAQAYPDYVRLQRICK